jgi:hypothetical protein
MTDRYTVINPDTLEAMRRAGYVAKLEARIEKLEAALLDLCDGWECCAVSKAMRLVAREALEGKDD